MILQTSFGFQFPELFQNSILDFFLVPVTLFDGNAFLGIGQPASGTMAIVVNRKLVKQAQETFKGVRSSSNRGALQLVTRINWVID